MADVDYAEYFDETGLKSPFYRVSLKVVVRDDQGRVLVTGEQDGTYELPGGGWDHGESVETGLHREIKEELGVEVTRIGSPLLVYKGRTDRPHVMMRVAFEAELASHNFTFNQDDPYETLTEARFVGREEFLALNWSGSEKGIVEQVDKLWPSTTPAVAVADASAAPAQAPESADVPQTPQAAEVVDMSDNDKISL